jgi:putative transposase
MMPRLARAIATDVPHHVTQRGNARRFVLNTEVDRQIYLELLTRFSELYHLSIAGYCLMSNHVHLIAVPRGPDSLARALQHAHSRYANYFNARYGGSGHVWQGRFYSCALDTDHYWAALRYTELNPVRAGLTARPEEYQWSSAAAHLGMTAVPWLDDARWGETWTRESWAEFLRVGGDADADAIRRNTHTGRPLGSVEFVQRLEEMLGRRLAPQRGGRPPGDRPDSRQEGFESDAE